MEHRKEPRIKRPCVIRYQQISPPTKNDDWEAVTTLNLSKSGLCFMTTMELLTGARLEIHLSNMVSAISGPYFCKVLRSMKVELGTFFKTVVLIEEMDEDLEKAFYQSIEEFIMNSDRKF